MIRVIVCGGCGKMGSKIVNLIAQDKEMLLAGIIERPDHPKIGSLVEGRLVEDNLERFINAPDVIIEFSNPIATVQHATIASQAKKAMVIGTTGLSEEQISHLKELAKNFPCVMAPNMSMGVNLLFKLVKEVAMTLPGYDAEIVEAHHNQKKDAPSGTAKKFAQILADATHKEIPTHAIRLGDIVGDHTIIFCGNSERIEIKHQAHSRDVFAYGAIKAAKWIVGKPAGLYDMQDVLQLATREK